MDEQLYTTRDAARIFDIAESRLLYWARTGVAGPSVRRGGRVLYTFSDLVTVKSAKELLDGGLTLQAVRKNLAALRTALPSIDRPLARLRIVSNGERLVVIGEDVSFEPLSGQLVMDFAVGALWSKVAEVMELPVRTTTLTDSGRVLADEATERSAFGWFTRGCTLDDGNGDGAPAEDAYRRALALDPSLAAAHTNLGNLAHRRGQRGEARAAYERALELDPEQPEARFNLANLLDELGEGGRAIYEWTRVVALTPDFADAHFNLGAAFAQSGDRDAARSHLHRYLALESEGEWAEQARTLLSAL